MVVVIHIEPSIRGRQLYIPHRCMVLWGIEDSHYPSVSIQYQTIYIDITFRAI